MARRTAACTTTAFCRRSCRGFLRPFKIGDRIWLADEKGRILTEEKTYKGADGILYELEKRPDQGNQNIPRPGGTAHGGNGPSGGGVGDILCEIKRLKNLPSSAILDSQKQEKR